MLADGVAKKEKARRTGLAYNTIDVHLRRIDGEREAANASAKPAPTPRLPYRVVSMIVGTLVPGVLSRQAERGSSPTGVLTCPTVFYALRHRQ